MLQLYDINKVKINGLKQYKDYCIESELSTGDKKLSFLYPLKLSEDIVEEGYIRTKKHEFVIKEISDSGDWKSILATLNLEDLEGEVFEHFDTTEKTITESLTLALAGTGWTIGTCNVTRRRTVRKTNCSSYDIIQEAKKRYRCEIEFDTLNKKINIFEKIGSDKGVYFKDSLNLKSLNVQSNSYDFYTRVIAKGKDDLKVIVENFQYSSKTKTYIWVDERYTDETSLREDATAKLNELSKPYRSYATEIYDLANMNSEYKDILAYSLGDTITLISKDKNIKEKQRIVKIVEYPEEPNRNVCEIANVTLKFEDIQKEFQDTTDTVNNITTDDGTVKGEAIDSITTSQISDFEASVGKITDLTVVNARIDNLYAEKADIGSLNAVEAKVGVLEATTAKITDLTAINANIANLEATKASIEQLEATSGKITVLESTTADIKNLLAGNITGESGQLIHLTAENVVIADAVIKDLIAANINVSDLNAGNISTNKFSIVSDSGKMRIADNTIQISDNNRVRVQIGKDAANDYSMYVWDSTGKLMFDATGLKADGIKNKIIRDDMISDNANINGGKLNIASVVTSVNNGTTLLKATKIQLDTQTQTLEVAFNSLKTQADGTKTVTESNVTQIGVINGEITTLIKDTTIEENGNTVKLKDAYSSLKQTVNGLSSTVSSNSTSITTLNIDVGNAQSTANNANALADSKAKVFTSTPITPYKVGDVWTSGPSGDIMKCKTARASGSYVASDWEKASKYTDDTTANVVDGKVTTLTGKVTTVENKQTSLEQNLEGFKTTVSGNYSTKSELSTVDGKVVSLTSRVSTAESSITQLDNKIALKVEATEVNSIVNNAVNNIQVGGRNFLIESEYFNDIPSNWLNNMTVSKCDGYMHFIPKTTTTDAHCYFWNNNKNKLSKQLEKNKQYTLSFDVRTNVTRFRIGLRKDPSTTGQIFYDYRSAIRNGEWDRYYFTFTWNDKDWTNILWLVGVYEGGTDKYIDVKNWKLEGGNKNTGYTSAPEDVDSSITAVSAEVTKTNNKVAEIVTNLDSITQRVSATETTTATLNGNVTSLTSRVTTAEQKITDSAIINTVQSTINAAKTEAINSANGTTDTKLNNYATVSSLSQTSDSIIAKFESSGGSNLVRNSKVVETSNVYGFGSRVIDVSMLTVGKTYTLTFRGRTVNNSGGKYLRVYIYTPDWGESIYKNITDTSIKTDSITFVATSAMKSKGLTITSYHYPSGGDRTGSSYIEWYNLTEGSTQNIWTPHHSEIFEGNTAIDANGVTITNGAITIMNKAGSVVLQGDVDGNLVMNHVNGEAGVSINSGGFDFTTYSGTNGMEKVAKLITTSFPQVRDQNGLSICTLDPLGDYIQIGYQRENGSVRSAMYFIPTGVPASFNLPYTDAGVYVKDNIYFDSTAKFNTFLDIKSSAGTNHRIYDSSGYLGLSGDNGVRLGYYEGNVGYTRMALHETPPAGTGDHIESWGNYNFRGYTFHNAGINAKWLEVSGSKNCVQETENFGKRLINAYETAEYYFGDIGSGTLNDDGECIVFIDDIFQECVNMNIQYHVFTQAYNGVIKTIEREKGYFIIQGEPGTKFSWELKAKRKGYENNRLEMPDDLNVGESNLELFSDEDFKVDNSEDLLNQVLDFNLDNLLLEG